MKLNVKIGEKNFSVEVEDLNTRPIIAVVDGERFEVTPESNEQDRAHRESSSLPGTAHQKADLAQTASTEKNLPAPLPGTVIEIFVKPGDLIETGQILLVIEAMKMKNSIRSTREGRIAAVLVSAGQTVNHKQPLVEFE